MKPGDQRPGGDARGGKLTIKTRNGHPGRRPKPHLPGAYPGTFVCLSVIDTGIGMDQETVRRPFEPFFGTKQQRDRAWPADCQPVSSGQYTGWNRGQQHTLAGLDISGLSPCCFSGTGGKRRVRSQRARCHLNCRGWASGSWSWRTMRVSAPPSLRCFSRGGYVVFEAANAREAQDHLEREGASSSSHSQPVRWWSCPTRMEVDLVTVDQLLAAKPVILVLDEQRYMDERAQWPPHPRPGIQLPSEAVSVLTSSCLSSER